MISATNFNYNNGSNNITSKNILLYFPTINSQFKVVEEFPVRTLHTSMKKGDSSLTTCPILEYS